MASPKHTVTSSQNVFAIEDKLLTLRWNISDLEKLQEAIVSSKYNNETQVHKLINTQRKVTDLIMDISAEFASVIGNATSASERKSICAGGRIDFDRVNKLEDDLVTLLDSFSRRQFDFILKLRLTYNIQSTEGLNDNDVIGYHDSSLLHRHDAPQAKSTEEIRNNDSKTLDLFSSETIGEEAVNRENANTLEMTSLCLLDDCENLPEIKSVCGKGSDRIQDMTSISHTEGKTFNVDGLDIMYIDEIDVACNRLSQSSDRHGSNIEYENHSNKTDKGRSKDNKSVKAERKLRNTIPDIKRTSDELMEMYQHLLRHCRKNNCRLIPRETDTAECSDMSPGLQSPPNPPAKKAVKFEPGINEQTTIGWLTKRKIPIAIVLLLITVVLVLSVVFIVKRINSTETNYLPGDVLDLAFNYKDFTK